jgi:hypothetical protein
LAQRVQEASARFRKKQSTYLRSMDSFHPPAASSPCSPLSLPCSYTRELLLTDDVPCRTPRPGWDLNAIR